MSNGKHKNNIKMNKLENHLFVIDITCGYINKLEILNMRSVSKLLRMIVTKVTAKYDVLWDFDYIIKGGFCDMLNMNLEDIHQFINYKIYLENCRILHNNRFTDKIKKIVCDKFCNIPNEPMLKNLTHLTLGDCYDNTINKDMLPKSITHLTFGLYTNCAIEKGALHHGITHLELCEYRRIIDSGVLPNSLTHLTYYNYSDRKIVFPHKLTHLTIIIIDPLSKHDIPNSVTHLTLNYFSDDYKQNKLDVLPNGLTHITLNYFSDDDEQIDFIPNPLSNFLPNSLTHITFGEFYNQPIEKNTLPNSVTHIIFGDHYDQPIKKNTLPNGLKYISICVDYDKHIEIPNNCTIHRRIY